MSKPLDAPALQQLTATLAGSLYSARGGEPVREGANLFYTTNDAVREAAELLTLALTPELVKGFYADAASKMGAEQSLYDVVSRDADAEPADGNEPVDDEDDGFGAHLR